MPIPDGRRLGVALVMLSALAFSTAGLFTKGVAAPAWDIIFWRGLFSAAMLTAFIALQGRLRPRARPPGPARPGPWPWCSRWARRRSSPPSSSRPWPTSR